MKAAAPPELLGPLRGLLLDLAKRRELSNLRHGVADVERGRTYFDLARLEMEACSVLNHDVAVISSDAPSAPELAGPELSPRHPA